MPVYELTIGDATYELSHDRELTPTEIEAEFASAGLLTQDTGQSLPAAALNSAARGFASLVPGAIGGLGVITGSDTLTAAAESMEGAINETFPVNPALADTWTVKGAGAIGNAASFMATGGVGGLVGKGLGAIRTGAEVASLGSGFLAGTWEGAGEAERLGLEGGEAYFRSILGGVTETVSEKLLFGLGTETAAARRLLGDKTVEGKWFSLPKAAGTESVEEGAANVMGNAANIAMAPADVDPGGLFEGTGEAMALGAIGGGGMGVINMGVSAIVGPGEQQQPAATPPPPSDNLPPLLRQTFNGQDFIRSNGQWMRPLSQDELANVDPTGDVIADTFAPLNAADAVEGNLVAQLEARARAQYRQTQSPPPSAAQTETQPAAADLGAGAATPPVSTGAIESPTAPAAETITTPLPEPGATVETVDPNAVPPTFTGSTQPPGPSEGEESGPMSTTAPAGGPAASGLNSPAVPNENKPAPNIQQSSQDSLPDPTEGADLISAMRGQRLSLGAPVRGTAEWEWYEQLEREAAESPLKSQSAEAAARRGEVDDPKARLAWLHQQGIVNPEGQPGNLDEVAGMLNGDIQSTTDDTGPAFQTFPVNAGELGPAVLAAIDTRAKARQQADPTAELEKEQIERERSQARSFLAHALSSPAPQRTGAQLANETAEGSLVQINGRTYIVAEVDPTAGTVSLEDPDGEHGYQQISAEEALPIESIDGQLVTDEPASTEDSDTPFSLAAFPETSYPERQKVIDRLKAKVGALVQTSYPPANRYADALLRFYAIKASTGRLNRDDWARPQPPIYRPGYVTHKAAYDKAAAAVRNALQESAQDVINYSLDNGRTDTLRDQQGGMDATTGQVRAQTQAPPLPSDPASRIEAVSAALRKALRIRRLPARVQILHSTAPVTLNDGSRRQWKARVRGDRIEINAANIQSEADAIWNLEHELAHEAFRSPSPPLRRAWQRLNRALANHADIRAEVETLRYTPDQLTEEQAVRLAQKLDERGPWTEAWQALKEAVFNFITSKWGDITTTFTDRISAALAARAIMADARARLAPQTEAEMADFAEGTEIAGARYSFAPEQMDLPFDGAATPPPNAPAQSMRSKWPDVWRGFPNVQFLTTFENVARNGDKQRMPYKGSTRNADWFFAKGHGDQTMTRAEHESHAARLVQRLVAANPQQAAALLDFVSQHPNAILAPIRGLEAPNKRANMIPPMFAREIAGETGNPVTEDFVKTNTEHNTGKDSEERLFTPHSFSGTITPGADYLVVDDISTTGATAHYAARFIEAQGGNVVGVLQLGIARRKPFHRAKGDTHPEENLAMSQHTRQRLLSLAPEAMLNDVVKAHGIANHWLELTDGLGRALASNWQRARTVLSRGKAGGSQDQAGRQRLQQGAAFDYRSAPAISPGRAQPLDAPVLTPDGYRPIGSLAISDALASTDGTPSTVTGVYPQGARQVFKFTLADGRTVRATDDHLWLVRWQDGEAAHVVKTRTLRALLAEGESIALPVIAH